MNIRLSAFWERSLFEEAVTDFPSTLTSETSAFGSPHTVLQSGLRLVSEIDLFQGMQIRPFATLIEGGATVDDIRDTRGVVGLVAFLSPSLRTYDLAMAVDYGDRVESTLRPADLMGTTKELTLSLNFRYRLKDLMRISLTGYHTFGDLAETLPASSQRGRAASDLFLLFDLSY